jgi:hypothetical protein
VRDELGELLN